MWPSLVGTAMARWHFASLHWLSDIGIKGRVVIGPFLKSEQDTQRIEFLYRNRWWKDPVPELTRYEAADLSRVTLPLETEIATDRRHMWLVNYQSPPHEDIETVGIISYPKDGDLYLARAIGVSVGQSIGMFTENTGTGA